MITSKIHRCFFWSLIFISIVFMSRNLENSSLDSKEPYIPNNLTAQESGKSRGACKHVANQSAVSPAGVTSPNVPESKSIGMSFLLRGSRYESRRRLATETLKDIMMTRQNLFITERDKSQQVLETEGCLEILVESISKPIVLEKNQRMNEDQENSYQDLITMLRLIENIIQISPSGEDAFVAQKALEELVTRPMVSNYSLREKRLDLSLRRDALAALSRVDLTQSLAIFRNLPGEEARSFFLSSMLSGMVVAGWTLGAAVDYLEHCTKIDDPE